MLNLSILFNDDTSMVYTLFGSVHCSDGFFRFTVLNSDHSRKFISLPLSDIFSFVVTSR